MNSSLEGRESGREGVREGGREGGREGSRERGRGGRGGREERIVRGRRRKTGSDKQHSIGTLNYMYVHMLTCSNLKHDDIHVYGTDFS